MKYLLATALRHIRKNAAVYLLIVIEITIGLAAVLCCHNILGGAKQQLAETKKELVGKNIEIEWRIPGIDINDPLIDGISYEKAMAFYEAFKNKADVCFAKKDINSFNVQNENGEWEGVAFRVMFVNDEMFEYFFGTPMRHDTVYADKSVYGEDVYGFISSAQENKKTTSDYYAQNTGNEGNIVRILSTKDGELYFMSNIPIKIEHQPTPRVEITDGNGAYRQYTSETVFIPLDYYPLYMEKLYPIIIKYKNSPEKMRYIPISKLMLVFRNEDFDANFISQAVTYLEETDNEKGYIYINR